MTSSMRVATWNLMRARPDNGRRSSELLTHMDSISPDVWVLTETFRDFRPGPEYALIGSSADAKDRDTAHGECWVAVWSRLPATPVDLRADPERTAAARVQPSGGIPLLIVGTVLPWLADSRYTPIRGADAFCEVLGHQPAEWSALQQEHPDAGICVAGDFNQDLAPKHYYGSSKGRAALGRALAETRLVCLTGGESDPLAGVSGHASIDHLCVSEWLVPHEDSQVGTWPSPPLDHRLSDHFGVYVDVELTARLSGSVTTSVP